MRQLNLAGVGGALMANGSTTNTTTLSLGKFSQWLPALAMVVAVIVGYVQLSEAVKTNARTIEKNTQLLSRLVDLQVSDSRQAEQITTIRRDMTVMWQAIDRLEHAQETN